MKADYQKEIDKLYLIELKQSNLILKSINISLNHWKKQKEIQLNYKPLKIFKKKYNLWKEELDNITEKINYFEEKLEYEKNELNHFRNKYNKQISW